MKEQKIVESYSVVTQVKPLARPDIQLPKLEKLELDMTSDKKAQYTYQDSKLFPNFSFGTFKCFHAGPRSPLHLL